MVKRIDELGRVVIPADIRGRVGLKLGDKINFREEGGEIIITPASVRCKVCFENKGNLNTLGVCEECTKKIKEL